MQLEVLNTLEANDPKGRWHCVFLREWFDYRGHVCMVFEKLGLSLYDYLRKNAYQPFSYELVGSSSVSLLSSGFFFGKERLSLVWGCRLNHSCVGAVCCCPAFPVFLLPLRLINPFSFLPQACTSGEGSPAWTSFKHVFARCLAIGQVSTEIPRSLLFDSKRAELLVLN